jgi:hypothetical protein
MPVCRRWPVAETAPWRCASTRCGMPRHEEQLIAGCWDPGVQLRESLLVPTATAVCPSCALPHRCRVCNCHSAIDIVSHPLQVEAVGFADGGRFAGFGPRLAWRAAPRERRAPWQQHVAVGICGVSCQGSQQIPGPLRWLVQQEHPKLFKVACCILCGACWQHAVHTACLVYRLMQVHCAQGSEPTAGRQRSCRHRCQTQQGEAPRSQPACGPLRALRRLAPVLAQYKPLAAAVKGGSRGGTPLWMQALALLAAGGSRCRAEAAVHDQLLHCR